MLNTYDKTEFTSESVTETEKFAADFAKRLKIGDTVAFRGGLGVGKTSFTRGVATGLGYKDSVSSPTFTCVNEYVNIYHFDMYRIKTAADLESIGYYDYDDGINIIEWFENIEAFVAAPDYIVTIEIVSENTRKITIEGKNIETVRD
jgi:tRNA threonylcarbamoyladenosine biosynthesis protein TsaE